jgi:hypothetical protein
MSVDFCQTIQQYIPEGKYSPAYLKFALVDRIFRKLRENFRIKGILCSTGWGRWQEVMD